MAHRVSFIRGDGTGPELADQVARILESTGVEFEWDWQEAGTDVYEEQGTPLPDSVLESIRENKVAMKAPITTPVGTGFRSVNVAIRKELDLYSCQRPCKSYEGVRTKYPEADFVVIRENTEDLYAGIEFEKGAEGTLKLIDFVKEVEGSDIRKDSGISIKPISEFGSERIVRSAFEYAQKHGRKKVTAAHKANIQKYSDGLFKDVAEQVSKNYSDIEYEDRIIDNLCNQIVSRPDEYDVIVTENLYGDIVSDLGAGMIGGLGLAPGSNIGDDYAVFEATHGSAPKYAGQDKVNPSALLLSGVMMLHYLEESDAADNVEKSLAEVIAEGDNVTYDLKENRDDPSAVGTSGMADAIIEKIQSR
ncbi:MAG: isocitrate/isopropylmalate dehydrogenase family protein [Solirubrobacterales bacterium]